MEAFATMTMTMYLENISYPLFDGEEYLNHHCPLNVHQVTKRDEDSSLMQLKEEFRTYEALRREHDSQIVQIAMEGGLRIAPDQWSSLLYGDQSHKSHMQSIIDKVCLLSVLPQLNNFHFP